MDDFYVNLEGQVAIITGAAQGIGKVIAEKFASFGANLIICDLNQQLLEELNNQLVSEYEISSLPVKVDVSKKEEVEEMVKKGLDKFNRIDILINNAGITRDNLVVRMSDEDWDKVLSVNLKGVFNCTHAVSRIMLKQKRGKIVNIASIIGITGNVGQANYAASKAGVIAFTKSCAKEFASRKINVNAVAPGFIGTEMTDKLSEEVKETMFKNIPAGRFGTPLDVANVVCFLVSEAANYINGETIKVTGGM